MILILCNIIIQLKPLNLNDFFIIVFLMLNLEIYFIYNNIYKRMFSAEAMVSMADGSKKHINTLHVGDFILNKLNKPVKIRAVVVEENIHVVVVQLNNGSGLFYTSPNSKFLCHHTNNTNEHTSHFDIIQNIYADSGYLKSNLKIFSPETDISISSYDDSNASLEKTVYCIQSLNDTTSSYIVNGVIVQCFDI